MRATRRWPPTNRLLATLGYRVGERTAYALEGAIFSAGSTIQWLRDQMGLIGGVAGLRRRWPSP